MPESRRTVLKTVGAAGVVGGMGSVVTAESGGDPTRLIEVGVRYDVPEDDSYETVRPDSRPPYTVDRQRNSLIVLDTASPSTRRDIREKPEVVAEQPVQTGTRVNASPGRRETTTLPLELSRRMRVKQAVQLTEPVKEPNVVVLPSESRAAITVQGHGSEELSSGERREISLDRQSVSIRTSSVVGEASIDAPEWQRGLERTYGETEVEARPVVVARNHGRIVTEEQ